MSRLLGSLIVLVFASSPLLGQKSLSTDCNAVTPTDRTEIRYYVSNLDADAITIVGLDQDIAVEILLRQNSGGIESIMRVMQGAVLSRLTIPAEEALTVGKAEGEISISKELLDSEGPRQAAYVRILAGSARFAEQALAPARFASFHRSLSSYSRLVTVSLEKQPRPAHADGSTARLGIFGTNDRCAGACGPACDWCACLGSKCLCETNLFCEIHDRHCGAWEDFFNCDFLH